MQSIANFSNIGVPGRYIFRIDEWIQPAGCLDVQFDYQSIYSISNDSIEFFYILNIICRKATNLA